MLSSFAAEFHAMLKTLSEEEKAAEREVSVATGEASYAFLCGLVGELQTVCPRMRCHVYCVKNNFFGGQVTVTGLLTGRDMAEQLADCDLGETLYLSRATLRSEGDLFLCGMTPDELSHQLGVPLCFTENDGGEFLLKLLNLGNL